MSPSEPTLRLAAGQLEHAWLARVNLALNPEWQPGQPLNYRVEHDEPTITFGSDDDKDWAVLSLAMKIEWDGDGQAPFALELTVEGLFSWQKNSRPEELMRAWLAWNGVYLLWPYARTFVSTITGFSALPPLTIYTMRVPDPPELEIEKSPASERPRKKQPTSRGTRVARPTAASRSTAPRKKKPKSS